MCEVVQPIELNGDDKEVSPSELRPLIAYVYRCDVRNFQRQLRKADIVDIDLDLVTSLLNLWTSNNEWAALMFSSLLENSPISKQSLFLKICQGAAVTSKFYPEILHLMGRAGMTLSSKEPAADCLRLSILAGATELTKTILNFLDSPHRRVDSMELQVARRLFKGTASRNELATCLAVRRQHNIVKPHKTQLKRFQNVHPFFTEVEADFLSVIMEKLCRKQDAQVQAILLAEKYLGADTLPVIHELSMCLGAIHVETGAFAKDVLDLAEIVLNEAPADFVRITSTLSERSLDEYTQDISMFKLSRFLSKVCTSKLQLNDGFTAFVAALLARSDGSAHKVAKEYQAALFYGAACVHELSSRTTGEFRFADNSKGLERARKIVSSIGKRSIVNKGLFGWRGSQSTPSLLTSVASKVRLSQMSARGIVNHSKCSRQTSNKLKLKRNGH